MKKKTFTIKLLKPDEVESAYFIVPFNVQEEYGSKARVFVKGTIDGYPYRSSIAPMGNGKHAMLLNKDMRNAIGKTHGDIVEVEMERDDGERIINIPEDFQKALNLNIVVKNIFDTYAYTHRREYVNWINSAKKPETRQRRIIQAIDKISKQKKLS